MTAERAYWRIPIQDRGEPLVEIPLQDFAAAPVHTYQELGAPYDCASPYAVRVQVLEALYQAQEILQQQHPQWRLFIFDAYRPLAVQSFMAHYAYESLVREQQLNQATLSTTDTENLWKEVYQIWAPPNVNPLTPPPHSTGGAIDLTLFDLTSRTCVDMGSPIDELSTRSQPDYFNHVSQTASSPEIRQEAEIFAQNRHFLADAMIKAGFQRHPGEWWHFCLGDQMWVWLSQPHQPDLVSASYGRYDLVPTHN